MPDSPQGGGGRAIAVVATVAVVVAMTAALIVWSGSTGRLLMSAPEQRPLAMAQAADGVRG